MQRFQPRLARLGFSGILSPPAMLAISLLLTILLRVPHYQHEFVFIDEAWWAMGSKALADGGRLYTDLWMDKQPPIFLLGSLLFRVFGQSMVVIHTLAILLAMLTSTLLYAIGARFFSREVGGAAAIIYSLASTTFYMRRLIGLNVESLMVVFTAWAMYLFLRAYVQGQRSAYLSAGVVSALAAATKPVACMQLGYFFVLIFLNRRESRSLRLKDFSLVAGGYAAGCLILLGYLYSTDSLSAWWTQCMVYPVSYMHQVPAGTFLKNLLQDPTAFILIYAWLCILIWRGLRTGSVDSAARTALAAWMIAGFLGVVVGRRFYTNYYVQMLPSMCLLGGLGAIDLWKSRSDLHCLRLCRVAAAAFLTAFLWFHTQTLAHWIYLAYPDLHQRYELWSTCRENRELQQIAAHLHSRSNEGESIFVWGSRAELFWLADRKPALDCLDYDVRADVPDGAADARKCRAAVDALDRSLPRYVVDLQGHHPIDKFQFFGEWIREHYRLETTIHKARLFRLNEEGEDIRTAKQRPEALQDRVSGGM